MKKYLGIEKPSYTQGDFDALISRVILHEIGHGLIDSDEHVADVSVRNGQVQTLTMLDPGYQKFLFPDIKELQQNSCVTCVN